ncbi:MAG: hypothetical protein BroJett040_21980 [Oligoflexia bacterium]|nr:MAG: hypothetical protein BroJett040_21980 [Oligoflexia bacterium]
MKIISSLLIVGFCFGAFALPTPTQIQDICSMDPVYVEGKDEPVSQELLNEMQSLNVAKVATLSKLQLQLVNRYLISQLGVKKKILSLREVQDLFKKGGELQWSELYLNTYQSSVSGEIYLEVLSYPGDNPVADYFDQGGLYVGHNSDGSFGIPQGKDKIIWCSDLRK